MRQFEHIVGLMHGNGPGSATLDQHVAAMAMDKAYAWTFNQLMHANERARNHG